MVYENFGWGDCHSKGNTFSIKKRHLLWLQVNFGIDYASNSSFFFTLYVPIVPFSHTFGISLFDCSSTDLFLARLLLLAHCYICCRWSYTICFETQDLSFIRHVDQIHFRFWNIFLLFCRKTSKRIVWSGKQKLINCQQFNTKKQWKHYREWQNFRCFYVLFLLSTFIWNLLPVWGSSERWCASLAWPNPANCFWGLYPYLSWGLYNNNNTNT